MSDEHDTEYTYVEPADASPLVRRMVEAAERGERLAVIGGPGAGKTFGAVEVCARMLAVEGARIGVITRQRLAGDLVGALAARLRAAAPTLDGLVEAAGPGRPVTYHSRANGAFVRVVPYDPRPGDHGVAIEGANYHGVIVDGIDVAEVVASAGGRARLVRSDGRQPFLLACGRPGAWAQAFYQRRAVVFGCAAENPGIPADWLKASGPTFSVGAVLSALGWPGGRASAAAASEAEAWGDPERVAAIRWAIVGEGTPPTMREVHPLTAGPGRFDEEAVERVTLGDGLRLFRRRASMAAQADGSAPYRVALWSSVNNAPMASGSGADEAAAVRAFADRAFDHADVVRRAVAEARERLADAPLADAPAGWRDVDAVDPDARVLRCESAHGLDVSELDECYSALRAIGWPGDGPPTVWASRFRLRVGIDHAPVEPEIADPAEPNADPEGMSDDEAGR